MRLIDLRNEVLAKGFDSNVFSGRINQYLNDGLDLIARRVNYYVDEASLSVTTTAGVATFAFPADFARARSLMDTDRNVELQYVGLRDIDRSVTSTGAPNFYAVDGANIHVYPTPDSSTHNLRLRYWKLPATLVNDTDVPSIPTGWHHILWVYATWMCYESEDDAQMGQYWMGRFQTELGMFAADQKFPDADGPNVARGMWDSEPTLSPAGGWTLYGGW